MLDRKKPHQKVVKVEIQEQDAIIDMLTIVEYGVAIADVTKKYKNLLKVLLKP